MEHTNNNSTNTQPAKKGIRHGLKTFYQDCIFETRWVLVLFTVGLILGMLFYAYQFGIEIKHSFHEMVHSTESNENSVMLFILALVDMTMIAQMVIFVIQGSHLIFVGDLNPEDELNKPRILRHITSTSLKVKLFQSLMGISAIALLRIMVDMHDFNYKEVTNWVQVGAILTKAGIQIVIHLLFVHSTRVLSKIDLEYHPITPHAEEVKDKGATDTHAVEPHHS